MDRPTKIAFVYGGKRCRECQDYLEREGERVLGLCVRCLARRRRTVIGPQSRLVGSPR